MAVAIFLVFLIIVLLLAIGIICIAIYSHFKKNRLTRDQSAATSPDSNTTRSEASSIQQRQQLLPGNTGNSSRINLRPIRTMEQQIPEVQRPIIRVNTVFNRRLSASNTNITFTVNNENEPISPPPPPLPPRNSTIMQRNTTTVVYNGRDGIFQMPPSELSPIIARNSLLRTSRSSQFVQMPSGFLNFGLGTSPFVISQENRFDLSPWVHGFHENIQAQQMSNHSLVNSFPAGCNIPFKVEDDLPPSYDEAMKMKDVEPKEFESTDL